MTAPAPSSSTAPIGDGYEGDDATIEGYVVSRLWTSTVSDDCGNEDTAYAYQYIVGARHHRSAVHQYV